MSDSKGNDNQAKRLTVSLPLLLCYSLFTAWQMGVMYFIGTAMSLNGRTPLPITADDLTVVIVVAYILSILYLIFFQKHVVVTGRIVTVVSLATAVGLFLPLSDDALAFLITIQAFCCVFLIGITISVAVGMFTEKTELYDVLITAVFANTLVAVLQNDTIQIPFTIFCIFSVVALALVLFFFIRMPSRSYPLTVKKHDRQKCPVRFSIGIYILVGLSCMLTLFGIAVGESITNGVSVVFVSAAVCGAVVFALWKLFGISPLRCASILIGLSAVGFVLALARGVSPILLYISCVLIGCGYLACLLNSFYGIVLFTRYPSRFVMPLIITLAVITVLLHSSLLDMFRNNVDILYILYAVAAVCSAILYLIVEPSLIWSMKRGEKNEPPAVASMIETENAVQTETPIQPAAKISISALDESLSPYVTENLSGQELRIAELILSGYANAEMAEMLDITVNTVKSYRKNLYEKLLVHSRRELFSLVNYGKRDPS